MLQRLVHMIMARELRRTFRRVLWLGGAPDLPAGVPVVLYANHHYFHDGYLLWLVLRRLLQREGVTWMADWDRFPFFAAAGALPFPPDDPARRAQTIRRTIGRFRERPETVLVLFPEGRLHRPEEGVLPFAADALRRLDRILPEKVWWPVALHVTWLGEDRPSALLTGGTPHRSLRGDEAARIETLLEGLRSASPEGGRPLLEGKKSIDRDWNLALARKLFLKHLR